MRRLKKTDIIAALTAGWLIALFLSLVTALLGADKPRVAAWQLFLALPVGALLGLFAAEALARQWAIFWQLFKFLLVGALNTAVDLGVFNILKTALGTFEAGFVLTGLKGVSFIAAVLNSFLWNKFWVFEKKESKRTTKELGAFFLVSVIGIILNAGFFYFLTAIIGSPQGIAPALWHNLAALIAGLAVFAWNFLGYKLIVFQTERPQ